MALLSDRAHPGDHRRSAPEIFPVLRDVPKARRQAGQRPRDARSRRDGRLVVLGSKASAAAWALAQEGVSVARTAARLETMPSHELVRWVAAETEIAVLTAVLRPAGSLVQALQMRVLE
jgi:hypothetical protein